MKRLLFFLIISVGMPLGIMSESKQSLVLLTIDGVINPVVGDYVSQSIQQAEKEGASAVLIELNTPGGLLDATRTTISAMINSSLPVIVYVTPRGSRATSAGVFITMAADVAAMAPETHIGAAHPVSIGGDTKRPVESTDKIKKKINGDKASEPQADKSVMEEKMVSDSAAYIRALAKDRGRNADWAEKAVRESVSLTSDEALKQGVIELIAESREDLIQKLNSRSISKNKKTIVLDFKNSTVTPRPMSRIQKFLHLLAHPNVAYILMMLGVYGLIYELSSPGIGFGGAVGGICLLMAFYSLQVLPVNTVGVVLLIFGVACMVVELLTPTHGLLTLGGLIAFALGSFMLIDVSGPISLPRVSMKLILPTVLTTGAFFLLVVQKAINARRAAPKVGAESLMGLTGEVSTDGLVFLEGELWSVECDESLNPGDHVSIIGRSGIHLKVKKLPQSK